MNKEIETGPAAEKRWVRPLYRLGEHVRIWLDESHEEQAIGKIYGRSYDTKAKTFIYDVDCKDVTWHGVPEKLVDSMEKLNDPPPEALVVSLFEDNSPD